MSYPLDFAHYGLEFSDGNRSNKHYNVSLLVNPDGMAIIVKRWGKVGQIGSFKIEKFAIKHKAEQEFEKVISSKKAKGYTTKTNDIKLIATQEELRRAFGPAVWPSVPGEALLHVLPEFDVTGRKMQAEPPRFDENGSFIGDAPARVHSKTDLAKARAEQAAIEQQEAVATYAANPKFGMF